MQSVKYFIAVQINRRVSVNQSPFFTVPPTADVGGLTCTRDSGKLILMATSSRMKMSG